MMFMPPSSKLKVDERGDGFGAEFDGELDGGEEDEEFYWPGGADEPCGGALPGAGGEAVGDDDDAHQYQPQGAGGGEGDGVGGIEVGGGAVQDGEGVGGRVGAEEDP